MASNYTRGSALEARRLNNLLDNGEAVRGARYLKSRGPRWHYDYDRMNDRGTDWAWIYSPVDIWYIGKDGSFNEEQIKLGLHGVGKIDTDEFLTLIEYAFEKKDWNVSLVSKESGKRKTHVWTFKNKEIE